MTQWIVRRSSVTSGSGCSQGITSWFVHTDGCTPDVVVPHIKACLEHMDIAGQVREGAYPFCYDVELPYPMSPGQEEACAELLSERTIKGEYCSERQRDILSREFTAVKIAKWTKTPQRWPAVPRSEQRENPTYIVQILATTMRPISFTEVGECSCRAVNVSSDRRMLVVEVDAKNESEVAAHLRLAGNMMHLRWDPREEANKQFFGEPLI